MSVVPFRMMAESLARQRGAVVNDKPVPVPTPDTQRFWDAASAGELWIQQCRSCRRHYFYPRDVCPHCTSRDVEWIRASGRATLWSYVINHLPARGFEDDAPYVIAIVRLEEGPQMLTNIIGVEPTPEALPLDLPLTVTFEARGDVAVPLFRPAEASA
jgi:uncharacterized OB-fold protein